MEGRLILTIDFLWGQPEVSGQATIRSQAS